MSIKVTSNHPKDSFKTLRELDYGTVVIHEKQRCLVIYASPATIDPCRKGLVSLENPGSTWTLGSDYVFREVLGVPKSITLEF